MKPKHIRSSKRAWCARTIWLNPPNDLAVAFTERMRSEYHRGSFEQGMLLINSALGYNWYEDLWRAYPVCCLRSRLHFVNEYGQVSGQAKKGQTIVYMGEHWKVFYQHWAKYGRILLSEELSKAIVEEFINNGND